MAEPRYVVRALKFHCGDESGLDWSGSDEPVWIFTANDEPTPDVRTRRSKEFSNVDSGDTQSFDMPDNNLVWPQDDGATGATGPIGLSIQLWEVDQGDADTIAKRTEQALNVAEWVPFVGQWVGKVRGFVAGSLVSLISDDLMGSQTISYTKQRLAQRLPSVGSKITDKFHFSGNSGDIPFGLGGSPDYDLYLEVTRVA